MLLQPNTLFANRYQLVRLLGRGGFSEVWLADDNWTHLNIAIKVYAPGQGMDNDGLNEFSSELAGVFNLNHTNLLKPTHVDSWEGMPYLIMAYCSQGSLSKRAGRMSEKEMWQVIHDVAMGLQYLHKNDIVHQDIKPDNILLDDAGNYVITDFGISTKARSTLRKSVIGGSLSGGTMAYMGPERFSKQPAPTKASDIWSLGAMCFELVTGNVPFGELGGGMQKSGAEIPDISDSISVPLKKLIEQMMAPETWDRPTAAQLVKTSAAHLNPKDASDPNTFPSSQPASGRPTARFVPTAEPIKVTPKKNIEKKEEKAKNKKRLIISVAVILTIVIGGIIGAVLYLENKEKAELITRHRQYVQQFDRHLQAANIDNLSALDLAIDDLHNISYTERQSAFPKEEKVYETKRLLLVDKTNGVYSAINGKWNRAPEGTTIKTNLKKKLDNIKEIKNKI